jgi:DNA invertase Pin-like site-specific DNA recombinase
MKYVTYIRVSTKEQGRSGHGLDAQKRDIKLYLDNYSEVPYEIVGAYMDVHSGADNNRPELKKAIALAKKEKAFLLVSKLDRLSRKVSFIAQLMEDKHLQLKIASMPNADKFQLHIYAALAEQERDFISTRTKAALREAKAKGVKLGGLRDATNARNKAKRKEADRFADTLHEIVTPLHQAGKNYSQISVILNNQGIKSAANKEFYPQTVKNIISRLSVIN